MIDHSALATSEIIFMREAIKQAHLAEERDEVPVGAVIVQGHKIIARAHNQVETLSDPTAHAEMIAITQATDHLSNKWLTECALYVTLEPCAMCAGALVLARIPRIYFGAQDPKAGACGSVFNIAHHPQLNHRIKIKKGPLAAQCSQLLRRFFEKKRYLINQRKVDRKIRF